MENKTPRKLESIELWFDDGRSMNLKLADIKKIVEVGEHLEEINRAVQTAKWLASLRSEP